MPRNRCFRVQTDETDSDTDEQNTKNVVAAAKYFLQSRKRKHGLDIVELDEKEKIKKDKERKENKNKKEIRHYDDDAPDIGTTFTVQSNFRDEEADMNAYINKRLKEIQGKDVRETEDKSKPVEDPLIDVFKRFIPPKRTHPLVTTQALIIIPDHELLKKPIESVRLDKTSSKKHIKATTVLETSGDYIPAVRCILVSLHSPITF